MSRAEVAAGVCGFSTMVRVRKKAASALSVSMESNCPKVEALGDLVPTLTMPDLFRPMTQNPVYLAADQAKLHGSCPVPCAVLKAAEVELGLALGRDVQIRIIKENPDRAQVRA